MILSEKQAVKYMMRRKDILLLLGILLFAAAAQWCSGLLKGDGVRILIELDGADYGIYDLDSDAVIEVLGRGRNIVNVSGGRAFVTDADCPDKYCMHEPPLSANGGMIVCLPNRMVIEIIGNSPISGLDGVAG